MKTEAFDFCKKYNEKKKGRKSIHTGKHVYPNISFYIIAKEDYVSQIHTFFKLDEKDLKYLYRKYSKKAKEELEQNIEELKEKYKL